MSGWNFNMDEAPRGTTRMVTRAIGKKEVEVEEHTPDLILAADASGTVVTMSRWLPGAGRWNMFTKTSPPIAWQPWPAHPLSTPTKEN